MEELRKEIEKLRAQPEPQAPMIHVNKPSRIPLRDCSAKTSDEELQKSETKEKVQPKKTLCKILELFISSPFLTHQVSQAISLSVPTYSLKVDNRLV